MNLQNSRLIQVFDHQSCLLPSSDRPSSWGWWIWGGGGPASWDPGRPRRPLANCVPLAGHAAPSDLSFPGMYGGDGHSDVSPLCPVHSVPGPQSVEVKSQASQQLQEEALVWWCLVLAGEEVGSERSSSLLRVTRLMRW